VNSVLSALNLESNSGFMVLGMALASGLVLGLGATMVLAELPFQAERRLGQLRRALTLIAGLGLLTVVGVLIALVLGGVALAPIILFAGLGLLGGPLIFQGMERMQGSRVVGLVALVLAEGSVVSITDRYLL